MLKLNAAYAKKVPAEGEYTSRSFHASIEIEIPDGLTPEQLTAKIHDTFAMVRESVEAEINGEPRSVAADAGERPAGGNTTSRPAKAAETHASAKQVSYLLALAGRRGITPSELAAKHHVATVADLTRKQVSALIDGWRAA